MTKKFQIACLYTSIISTFLILNACDIRNEKAENSESVTETNDSLNPDLPPKKIEKAIFFLENSASMYGYVNGATQFVNVVNDLAQDLSFEDNNTNCSYNLISGRTNPQNGDEEFKIYNLGDDPLVLKNKLSVAGYKSPTSKWSDLNRMFEIALDSTMESNISFLISDCIYDVGSTSNPLQTLSNEGYTIRKKFYGRLLSENIESLCIKLVSDFEGNYYPGITSGEVSINHPRPYYVWIFGDAELLNKYFHEDKLKRLDGFVNLARFQKLQNEELSYKAIGYENIGLRPSRRENNTYELSRNLTQRSKFTIAVDFSSLQISESYLTDTNNYKCSNGYEVKNVYTAKNAPSNMLKHSINKLPFKTTHIITISTTNPPQLGEVRIILRNILPNWIDETNTINDSPLNGNYTQTFGFSTLTNGISEAYMRVSDTDFFCQIEITVQK